MKGGSTVKRKFVYQSIKQLLITQSGMDDVSNTYVPFPQLFAKGNSLKSEGIGMPARVKNKGLHGNLGHVEPIYWPNLTKIFKTFKVKLQTPRPLFGVVGPNHPLEKSYHILRDKKAMDSNFFSP
jgi:hypothetical protein